MKKDEAKLVKIESIDTLYQDACQIIENARSNAVRSVDFCRVQMYWNLGKRIFEEEQQGKERADYGTYLIKNLSKRLTPEYGSGFSVRQLEQGRQFYRTYPIANTVRSQLKWSQYRRLIQIDDPNKLSTGFTVMANHLFGTYFFKNTIRNKKIIVSLQKLRKGKIYGTKQFRILLVRHLGDG